MPDRPQFALIVSDITASLKFYISYLGFTAVESQPAVARGKFSISPLDQNSIQVRLYDLNDLEILLQPDAYAKDEFKGKIVLGYR